MSTNEARSSVEVLLATTMLKPSASLTTVPVIRSALVGRREQGVGAGEGEQVRRAGGAGGRGGEDVDEADDLVGNGGAQTLLTVL